MSPGELSFCEGWTLLRVGRFEEAAEAFYNASLEITSSAIVYMFLGIAWVGVGEYGLAAAGFEEAYRLRPNIISYSWAVASHLGRVERYRDLISQIEGFVEVTPEDTSAWIALGMLSLWSEAERHSLFRARRAAGEIVVFGPRRPLAPAILKEVDRRDLGEEPPSQLGDLAVQRWLRLPTCESVGTLSLGVN